MTELSTVLSMMTEERLDERSRMLDAIELFIEKETYGDCYGSPCVSVRELQYLIDEMRR